MHRVDYLIATTWPAQQETLKHKGIHTRDDKTCWTRLEIIDCVAGTPSDKTGVVEFKAWFTESAGQQEKMYQERSDFIKDNGRWYFIYPNLPQTQATLNTPGRNDPCSCGSGKKYKKCCMR